MLRIRVIKTASGANAVQVVYYRYRKRVVFKHIGSAKSSHELESLKLVAQDVIKNFSPQITLFEEAKLDNLLYLDKSEWFPGLDEMCWWLEDISNNATRGA